MRILHRDAVARGAKFIGDFEAGPGARNSGSARENPPPQLDSQNSLHRGAVHPPGRSRIPGPTAAADMMSGGVNIGARDIRFDLVAMNAGTGARVIDGIEDRE